ncbi:hypothetical protein [Planococcus sp. ISL-109]|nr:hypothetical protein [Planococcus sp. ISL-109]
MSESKSGKIMLERFVDSDIGVQALYTAGDGHIVMGVGKALVFI